MTTTANDLPPSPCARCGLHHGDLIDDELVTIDPHSGLCLYCEAAAACYAEEATNWHAGTKGDHGYEDDYLCPEPPDEDW